MKTRVVPITSNNFNRSRRRSNRFDSEEETYKSKKQTEGFFGWCCTSTGFTKLGLILSIIGVIILGILAGCIPLIFILRYNNTGSSTNSTNSSNSLPVNAPKRLCIYYGWPSLVQNANWNVTASIGTFSQFDLIVFGDGISASTHGDHANTQTIIQALNSLGKLTFGYIDLGVTTQNLSISTMQTTVNNWAAMGVKGIFFDDAGYDFGVTRSRQNTMISYCHGLNLRVMMNAWNPDDVMAGSPVLLDSRDFYLLESYLISLNNYQNLTSWKIKADKCFAYSLSLGVSMACLATSTTSISASFSSTAQFSQAWFGTAMYNFDYFQATDNYYSSTNNVLFTFSNPISSYGSTWQTSSIQTDSSTHYYRSTDTFTLHIYGNGFTYGYGNLTALYSG